MIKLKKKNKFSMREKPQKNRLSNKQKWPRDKKKCSIKMLKEELCLKKSKGNKQSKMNKRDKKKK
jgi:hypothetical protein